MHKAHVETAKLASAVLEVHKPRPAEWTGWLRAQMALITMARLKRDDPSMSDDAASKETAKIIFCAHKLARDVWNKGGWMAPKCILNIKMLNGCSRLMRG